MKILSVGQTAGGQTSGMRMRFLDNRTDVAELMRASDLVVLGSANEPFERVLLEALSLGKPVVAPDRGGPVEIIGQDDRGCLFKAGNARDRSEAIRRVLQDPLAERERTARGRQWVARECSPLTHRSSIQALWEEVSTKGRGLV